LNVLAGYGLYLFSAFLLIALCLLNILPTNYLGGFVIAGFIGGVCFPWLNAVRQGNKMIEKERLFEIAEEEEKEELQEITVAA
jgi:hypothetical protein